jgi:hypothetical protein
VRTHPGARPTDKGVHCGREESSARGACRLCRPRAGVQELLLLPRRMGVLGLPGPRRRGGLRAHPLPQVRWHGQIRLGEEEDTHRAGAPYRGSGPTMGYARDRFCTVIFNSPLAGAVLLSTGRTGIRRGRSGGIRVKLRGRLSGGLLLSRRAAGPFLRSCELLPAPWLPPALAPWLQAPPQLPPALPP